MTDDERRQRLCSLGWRQAPLIETGGDEFWIPPRDKQFAFEGEDWLTLSEAEQRALTM